MAEYINLDTPLEAYRLRGNQHEPISATLRELLDFNKIPYTAADVAPVRHGRWVSVPHKKARICSLCEQDEPYKFADEDANVFDYCPHCGAKMDKEKDNG